MMQPSAVFQERKNVSSMDSFACTCGSAEVDKAGCRKLIIHPPVFRVLPIMVKEHFQI